MKHPVKAAANFYVDSPGADGLGLVEPRHVGDELIQRAFIHVVLLRLHHPVHGRGEESLGDHVLAVVGPGENLANLATQSATNGAQPAVLDADAREHGIENLFHALPPRDRHLAHLAADPRDGFDHHVAPGNLRDLGGQNLRQ